jgi:soluble lytic murein transglycosylase-like protein
VKPRGGTRASGARAAILLLVAALAVGLAALSYAPARRAARDAWSMVGLWRVESRAGWIREAAAESGVDPNLLAGLMYVESRGRRDAVSGKGALGLFQLMEASAGDAAKRLRLERPTREALLADGRLNTRLAAAHVAWLMRHEGPDAERVLVAYNTGRGRLADWIKKHGSYGAWRAKQQRDGDSQVLAFAREVIAARERFAARGRIAPEAAPERGGERAGGAERAAR